MPTLAELTLTLSQEITRNERERAAALAALEAERNQALAALPGAATPLRKHAEARLAAEADRDEARFDIDADLREALRLASSRRRADEDAAAVRLREADTAAEEARRAAGDKARAAFEAASLAIERRDLTPGQRVLARAEARRVMDAGLDAAEQAFTAARLANQDRLIDERRAAALRETVEVREQRDKADLRRTAAAQALALALRTGDRALEIALAAIPGAAGVLASFEDRRRGLAAHFDARAAALHAAFREAREKLPA